MTRTTFFTATLATAVGLFAFGAFAQQQAAQGSDQPHLSVVQIATLLEEQGYSVLEIEQEDDHYEVEMIDGNGMRVEAYLDRTTGEALPYHDDDEDEEDDERSDLDDDDDDLKASDDA